MVDLIGYIAGFFAMITFLPQVIKTLRTKKADDISLWMLVLTLLANIFYEFYAFILNLTPVIIMVGIMTVIVIVQIVLTLKYKTKNRLTIMPTGNEEIRGS
jgi:MtN3 and saliva related transmembrane protein